MKTDILERTDAFKQETMEQNWPNKQKTWIKIIAETTMTRSMAPELSHLLMALVFSMPIQAQHQFDGRNAADPGDFIRMNHPSFFQQHRQPYFNAHPHSPRHVLELHKPRRHKPDLFSDSLNIGWSQRYASQLAPGHDQATAVAVDGYGNVYVTGYSTKLPYGMDYLTIKYDAAGAEVWAVRYNDAAEGDNQATAIALDESGNVYVTGRSEAPTGDFGLVTIKYNSAGMQQWVARYERVDRFDGAAVLAVDDSGNVYVTAPMEDYTVIKYNALGAEQWVARYHDPGIELVVTNDLAIDDFGNSFVAGTSLSASNQNYTTIKFNALGSLLWVDHYDGPDHDTDFAWDLAVDAAGNVYVTGMSYSSTTSDDYVTIKYSPAGIKQWAARYNGPINGFDSAFALAVDDTGNVYVTGRSDDAETFGDYATIKYDSTGTQLWIDRYDGPIRGHDEARLIVLDGLGNVSVSGWSRSSGSVSYDEDDYATIKYNARGKRQWVTRYDGPANRRDEVAGMAIDASGNVYVTGQSESSAGDYDFATLKYNPGGIQQWAARYNGPGNSRDYGKCIAIDPAGNVYVSASSFSLTTQYDYLTIKYNAAGIEQWRVRYNGSADLQDVPSAVKVDQSGNVYVTGSSEGISTGQDYSTIKYSPAGVLQWVASYNGAGNLSDRPVGLEVDRAGNVYVTGSAFHSSSGASMDFTTIKYNLNGEMQWLARYDGPRNSSDDAVGLALDDLGNAYVTGLSPGAGVAAPGPGSSSNDFVTVKYSSAGVQLWAARYNGVSNSTDMPVAIAIDLFGNVYASGQSWSPTTSYDFATIKYNAYGIQQWVRYYNGPENYSDFVLKLAVDASGNAYVLGNNYTLIKYDRNGDELWVRRNSRVENETIYPIDLAFDGAGNVYVAGSHSFYLGSGTYHHILKYNTNGVEQWRVLFWGADMNDLAVDASGDIFLTGSTSGNWWGTLTTIKYTPSSRVLNTPRSFSLLQNSPNPFYYATSIRYTVPQSGHVTLKVYNLMGQEVASLVSGEHVSGRYNVSWGGEQVPSGVYIYRLQGNGFTETKKLVLLK
jgi:uncharacterized delta-60 repeat protein